MFFNSISSLVGGAPLEDGFLSLKLKPRLFSFEPSSGNRFNSAFLAFSKRSSCEAILPEELIKQNQKHILWLDGVCALVSGLVMNQTYSFL